MRHFSQDLAHRLAAEYVLGTLRGRARQRLEAIAAQDPAVAAVIRRWESHLTPLVESLPPVTPPRRVWASIGERITPARAGATTNEGSGFWRAFGMVAGGLASVLFAAFLYLSTGPRSEPLFVAVVMDPDNSPRAVISMHSPDMMRVRMVKPWAGMKDQDLELWGIGESGPRSLGIVSNSMGDTMVRIESTDPRVRDAKSLAITMEPPGGSPTRKPTGSIVAIGAIAPVRRS